VFHQGLFGPIMEKMTSMAPVPVTQLKCDGDSYKCIANLKYGDGRWVAEWSTSVFQQSLFSHEPEVIGAMAPVPVTRLTCDGDSYKCTGNLDFGSGRWVAQWPTDVFHT